MIAHAQMSPLNTNSDVLSGAGCLKFGLRLRQHPYFVFTSSRKVPGESANLSLNA